ncbi:MAG: hypothetical protein PHN50_05215 [Bacteroidales bacterium]|nr:hypothetical protein [Bacteroidales bacterium]
MINRFTRSIVMFLFVLLTLNLSGQEERYFEEDSDIFIQQIAGLLDEISNKTYQKQGEALMQALLPRWQAGRFSKKEKDLIKDISEVMHQNNYRNYPYFFDFFKAINALASSSHNERSVINWLSFTRQTLENESQRTFGSHLEYSIKLLIDQLISDRGSTSWFLRNASYHFASDTALILQVEQADLVCASRRDSSLILNTSGIFYASDNRWKGRGGNTVWWRFGIDEKDLQLQFRDYSVDLSQSEYSADSVTFSYGKFFNFSMLGRFEDKVFSSPPGNRTSYPRFYAYFNDYELKQIYKNISYRGGFMMEGATVKGTGNGKRKARLEFYQDEKLRVVLQSSEFVMMQGKIVSNSAVVVIPLEQDSLYHPAVHLQYDDQSRRLILYRTETGLADSPFFDSFHKLDIHFEALYWIIDKPDLYFRQLEGTRAESTGFLQSMNYFSFSDFDRLRLIDNQHPMFSIENYLKAYGRENDIQLSYYADFIKKPQEQALTQLLRLAAGGYLVYDPDTQIAILNERFSNTLRARSGDVDYDVIRINSFTSALKPNVQMNFDSLVLNVSGVKEVVLSNAQRVRIFPEEEFVAIGANRDFTFSGFVGAGLFEFYTQESSFDYDKFKINLTQVDSLSFFVPLFNQPERADGSRDYVRVENVISNISGTLYIDQPDNKSGNKQSPQFPIFDSKNESYVYFQRPTINDNRLLKEDFYYVVNPFEIDSLDDFKTDYLRFEGYLNSAGIFPAIAEPLVVLQDYSLGFAHQTTDSLPMYTEKAFYTDSIFLSNQGFWGNGALIYGTSETRADSFVFYPDEVRALANRFEMREQEDPLSLPQAQSDTILFTWLADTNLVILQTVQNPLVLYNNVIFEGTARLSPADMKAEGVLNFGQATMASEYFHFNQSAFHADTSDFRLHTALEGEPAFVAMKYNAFVDFKNREAYFENTGNPSALSFPYNSYICTLDEANWLMDKDQVELKNITFQQQIDIDSLTFDQLIDLNLVGSEFISVHPDQDSLSFFSLKANYDLKTYAIEARDVKIIKTADAAVFPDDGLVRILEGARMETFKKAYIIADTANRQHHFSNAEVTIFGRRQYEASGEYNYIDYQENIFPIYFSAVFPDESGVTTASGTIEKSEQFKLSPHFSYAGKVFLKANEPLLSFDGAFRPEYACNQDETSWVGFSSTIDPRDIRIPLDTSLFDEYGVQLQAGLYYDPLGQKYYSAFLSPARSSNTFSVNNASGFLWYDRKTNSFRLEADNKNNDASTLELAVNRCLIKGKGELRTGLNLPLVDLKQVGTYEHLLIPDSTLLSTTVVFDFMFDEKLLQMMADSINKSAQKGAQLSQSNYLYTLGLLAGNDEMNRVQSELSLYGAARRIPDVYQKSLVFNNLDMSWDTERSAFISQGELRIANVLRSQVNKSLSGLVVFEKGRAGDAITFYLQPSQSEWYYFHYENGIMQAISSSQAFNERLLELKLEKRMLEDEASDFIYEFVIASKRSVVDFIRRYQLN